MDLMPVQRHKFTHCACIYFLLFQCALDQLFAFCTNKVLETKVAGKMASDMCRVAARVSLKKIPAAWLNKINNLRLLCKCPGI